MGGEAQVTVMVLKVDLGCGKCCRKIKKVLCSTPQIRDQLFDDKTNTVTVSVLCCTPEKVADKIRRKAGGTLKGLDIKPSQPPPPSKPPAEKPKEAPPADKPKPQQPQAAPPPKSDDKPKSAAPPPSDKPKSDDKPKPAAAPPPSEKVTAAPPPQKQQQQMPAGDDKPKKPDNPPQQQQMGQPPPPQAQGPPPMMKPNQPAAFESIPVAGYPSIFPPPVVYYDGGPWYQNQGMGMMYPQHQQPVYEYDGYQGRPVGDYYGGGRAVVTPNHRPDYYYGEDNNNPSTCSVM